MARPFPADQDRDQDRPRAEVLAELRQKLAPTAPKDLHTRPPVPTGLGSVDEALQGGLPRGRIVEVSGTAGRMSLSLGALAGATAQGLLTAFIDPADALDVQAAHVLGVQLAQVLWVRLPGPKDVLQAADLLLGAGGFGLVVLYLCGAAPPRRMDVWPRLVQRAEKSGAALLVVSDQPVAGSGAAVTLHLRGGAPQWQRVPGDRCALVGRDLPVEVVRSRLGAPGPARTERLRR